MVKLKLISELAGVSISTASRVLANKGNVSSDAREKVLNALAELKNKKGNLYVKGPEVSLTVGIFVSPKEEFINDDPMTSVDIVSLKNEIEDMGNRVSLFYNTGTLAQKDAADLPPEFRKIDVAIINDPGKDDLLAETFVKRKVPFLVTNGRFDDPRFNYVDYNNYDGARQAVEHLLDNGHTKIGVVTGPALRMVSINRLAAYRDALATRGIAYAESLVAEGSFSLQGGYLACKKLLAANPGLSAVFAFNDLSAIGSVRALKEAGFKVPEDVSVVGFDDMELAQYSEPPLTTVSRFKYDISELIARAADDLGRNQNIEHIHTSLKTGLVVRDSTSPFKRS